MKQPNITIVITEAASYYSGVEGEEPEQNERSMQAPHEPHPEHPAHASSNDPTQTAIQVEGFLRGAGYKLPAFIDLRRALKRVQELDSRVAHVESVSTERIENAGAWRRYAEALEAKIERGNGRLTKPLLEQRPEPRS